jgi:hypothetical protein
LVNSHKAWRFIRMGVGSLEEGYPLGERGVSGGGMIPIRRLRCLERDRVSGRGIGYLEEGFPSEVWMRAAHWEGCLFFWMRAARGVCFSGVWMRGVCFSGV